LLCRRPPTPPTTSTKATNDFHTCHRHSSLSSSSSLLVAFCQQDDHPRSRRRTMTTAIAATMVTDRPPNRKSPLHLASSLSHPPILLALVASVCFPYAAAVVRRCTVISHLAPVVLIVSVADAVVGRAPPSSKTRLDSPSSSSSSWHILPSRSTSSSTHPSTPGTTSIASSTGCLAGQTCGTPTLPAKTGARCGPNGTRPHLSPWQGTSSPLSSPLSLVTAPPWHRGLPAAIWTMATMTTTPPSSRPLQLPRQWHLYCNPTKGTPRCRHQRPTLHLYHNPPKGTPPDLEGCAMYSDGRCWSLLPAFTLPTIWQT